MEATAEVSPLTASSLDATDQPAVRSKRAVTPSAGQYDVIVIGAGPAGMAACIYLARKKLKTLLISKDIGGQTAWSSQVENYLGYTLLTGAELTKHFQDHLAAFKEDVTLKLAKDGVQSIRKAAGGFAVVLPDGTSITTRAIIIASGKQPKQLGITGEAQLLHRGVTYCAWCDGPMFKDKNVAIIGGGNSALDAAFSVENISRQIYVINNLPDLTADEVMIQKVLASQRIRVLNNTEAIEVEGDTAVSGLRLRDKQSDKEKRLAVEGVMIEIGTIPADDFVQNFVSLNEQHEIIIDKHNMTSVDGVFAAGDVTDVNDKQIIIAAGEGAKAAIQTAKWLSRQP